MLFHHSFIPFVYILWKILGFLSLAQEKSPLGDVALANSPPFNFFSYFLLPLPTCFSRLKGTVHVKQTYSILLVPIVPPITCQ